MPFLRDDNLTFHRFATDESIGSRRPSDDKIIFSDDNSQSNTTKDNCFHNITHNMNGNGKDGADGEPFSSPSVWTTSGNNFKHNNYTTETNDFQYIPNSSKNDNATVKNLTQNGSTAKLVLHDDDHMKQVTMFFLL